MFIDTKRKIHANKLNNSCNNKLDIVTTII